MPGITIFAKRNRMPFYHNRRITDTFFFFFCRLGIFIGGLMWCVFSGHSQSPCYNEVWHTLFTTTHTLRNDCSLSGVGGPCRNHVSTALNLDADHLRRAYQCCNFHLLKHSQTFGTFVWWQSNILRDFPSCLSLNWEDKPEVKGRNLLFLFGSGVSCQSSKFNSLSNNLWNKHWRTCARASVWLGRCVCASQHVCRQVSVCDFVCVSLCVQPCLVSGEGLSVCFLHCSEIMAYD